MLLYAIISFLLVVVRAQLTVPPLGLKNSLPSNTTPKYAQPRYGEPSSQPTSDEERFLGTATPFTLPQSTQRKTERKVETEVDCLKTHMIVTLRFSASFNCLVYPNGQYNRCILKRSDGEKVMTFTMGHGPCGEETDHVYYGGIAFINPIIEHNLMIQWERDVISEDDVSVVVRCDRPNDYNKTVTWSLETRDLAPRFERGVHPGPQMWMEIQRGEGPNAPPLSEQLVLIGDVLTLVFILSDKAFWFDSNVLSCFAIDGSTEAERESAPSSTTVGPTTSIAVPIADIQVIENGCSVKPKIFSHMTKERRETEQTGHSTLHYAHFKAFRFPTSRKVLIRCHVQVCYRNCGDLPPCSEAFHPRSAARRRRSPEESSVVEVNKVNMYRSFEVLLPEEGDAKNYVVNQSPVLATVTEDQLSYCYGPTAFYGTVIGLISFIIVLLVLIICWGNYGLHPLSYFRSK